MIIFYFTFLGKTCPCHPESKSDCNTDCNSNPSDSEAPDPPAGLSFERLATSPNSFGYQVLPQNFYISGKTLLFRPQDGNMTIFFYHWNLMWNQFRRILSPENSHMNDIRGSLNSDINFYPQKIAKIAVLTLLVQQNWFHAKWENLLSQCKKILNLLSLSWKILRESNF